MSCKAEAGRDAALLPPASDSSCGPVSELPAPSCVWPVSGAGAGCGPQNGDHKKELDGKGDRSVSQSHSCVCPRVNRNLQ